MTTVAIIGAGNVGGALARTFRKVGVPVQLGARSAGQSGVEGIPVAEPAEAARVADVVFLCVPGAVAVDAARGLGIPDGRVLVDCTNPVTWDPTGPVLAPPPQGSVAEAIQAALPGVRVVKGFNHFGAEVHAEPGLGGVPTPAFLAGDDPAAKQMVAELARSAGFDPVDAGRLANARLLEALAVLWIHLATKGGRGRRWAFKFGG